jgi:hypothetical protein
LFDFLSKKDLTRVSWKQVKTPAYLEMAMQYVSTEILWLGDYVEKQILLYGGPVTPDPRGTAPLTPSDAYAMADMPSMRFPASELYEHYISFCNEYRIKPDMILNRHKFGTALTDLNLGIKSKKASVMVFDMDLWRIKEELIKRKLIIPDEIDNTAPKEVEEDKTCIFEKYGLNPEDYI